MKPSAAWITRALLLAPAIALFAAPDHAKYLQELDAGRQALAAHRATEAVAHFRAALQAESTAAGDLELGRALIATGGLDEAFAKLKEASQLDPDNEAVYAAWSGELLHEGRLDEALQVAGDALRRNSRLGQVHYIMAKVLAQKRLAAEAAERAAAASLPPAAAAPPPGGAAEFAAEALRHLAAADEAGWDAPDFLLDYGTALNAAGKFAAAEKILARAARPNPPSGPALAQWALADDHLGRYAEAITHYEAALAATPDDPAALDGLALLYTRAGKPEARSPKMAELLATRACAASSYQNARYLDTLARACAAGGDFPAAIKWENKALNRANQLHDRELTRELQPRFNSFLTHKNEN